MRIIGIDPGSQKTGVGIIEAHGNHLRHIHHTMIRPARGDFDKRLYMLFSGLKSIVAEFKPESAAMEDIFVSGNVSSALKLGQARGALLAALGDSSLCVAPYPPTTVKQAVTGFGRADKEQVQHMVRVLLHPPGPLPEDAADALAVAICHAHHIPMLNRKGRRT